MQARATHSSVARAAVVASSPLAVQGAFLSPDGGSAPALPGDGSRARKRGGERMPTPRKVEQVAALVDVISRAEIAISAQYQGVAMSQQVELRNRLREAGAEMHVVKNTLLRIAAEQAGKPNFVELAEGPTA